MEEVELRFYEQSDGRRISRLPSGKVVLIHYNHLEKVHDEEVWRVQLEPHDMYEVAHPIAKVEAPGPKEEPTPVKAETEQVPSPPEPKRPPEPAASRAMPGNYMRPEDRVAIFVDGANLDQAGREAGYRVDYFELGKLLRGGASFRAAYYYVADFSEQDEVQRPFLDSLAHYGYIVRKKRVKKIWDKDEGQYKFKANIDIELVLDMVNQADNYDIAFLVSGDSDFESCVTLLRAQGKRVYVMTSEGTLSRELNHVADKPVFYLEDYRDLLERTEKPTTT